MTTFLDRGFPIDDYTPHGYLANPHAFARSWSEGHGGNLRSTAVAVGFGWLYPWARGARTGAQLEIGIEHGGDPLVTRVDFDRLGLSAPHHSALLFEYAWDLDVLTCRARFVLVGEDELGLEVDVGRTPPPDPLPEAGRGDIPPPRLGEEPGEGSMTLYLAAVGWRRDGEPCSAEAIGGGGRLDLGEPFGTHQLIVGTGVGARSVGAASSLGELMQATRTTPRARGERVAVGVAVPLTAPERVTAVLGRRLDARPYPPKFGGEGGAVPPSIRGAIDAAREQDARFWRGAARLDGDWPPSWRRGWVYDLETTRMCMFPAGGVFRDVWPSWMVQWPRAVLAEGSLDTLRLAYVDPELAKRAVLSLFRDAPAPNVPCIFKHGEPNMVAADGSVCGTSPAWCVPFYNLERLYERTLDRDWLAELYPFLAAYLEWWLTERTDPEGWAVYKCTWEAGEDDTPRLDLERRGDNVVSEYVRPVELQATMALSASVLARFADELRRPDDAARCRQVAERFAERTRSLWDPAAGRFRDWDRRAGRFLEPSGEPNYWGVDPCRYSALAFTPVLAGLASREQTRALARELAAYAGPPWTLWASWSYVVLEAALAAGERAFASRVANQIVGRVYDELDRRQIEPGGPTPGVAREYWPLDLGEWKACEGYGWGATTASFLVRQIFGFLESDVTSGLRFRLAPGLPESFRQPGRRYALLNLPYRGDSLDLEYTVLADNPRSLEVRVSATGRTACRVIDEWGSTVHFGEAAAAHRFRAEPHGMYEIELRPEP